MTAAIDITKDQRKTLLALLRQFIPGVAVWAYGSRVKWTARPNSDLDLVAFTTSSQRPQVAELKEALAESNLPFPVDLHVWDEVPERFHEIIRRECVVLQEAKQPASRLAKAEGWRDVLLEELADEVTVGHVGPMASEYVPEGIPFLRSQNVEPLRINETDLKFIKPEFHKRLRKSALSPGDVVIVRTGRPGACAVIPNSLPVANCSDLVIVRCGSELDPSFLAYYVNSVAAHHIDSHLVGAVQQHFNVGSARNMVVHLPSLPEQRAIAHILGTLDDKIELNRRMNETLEAMARALFKSWFVDFDPVRSKAEGRDPGLPKHIADLFPDSFEDSELGEIPKGWAVASIGQVADVIDCLHSKKPDRQKEGSPLLQLSNIRDDGLIDMEDTYFIDEADYRKWISRMEASPGDCVVTNVGRVGAVAQMPVGQKAALGRNMTGLRCKVEFPFPTVLIECLLSQAMRDEIVLKMDTGTILDALNVRNIPKLRFVRSPDAILRRFEEIARPLRARMERHVIESRTVGGLRDTLLPRLISGELRVKDTGTLAGTQA